MAKVISKFSEGSIDTVIIRVGIADDVDKIMFNSPARCDMNAFYREIEGKVEKLFSQKTYGLLKGFSINDIYVDYGSLYVVFTYSVDEITSKEILLIPDVVEACLKDTAY